MRILIPIRTLFRAFPAASRAGLIGLCASVCVWAGVRLAHHDARPRVFLLGDSFIGNYRFAPGQRLEDDLGRLQPGYRVDNWAQAGDQPLDFLLQLYRGRLIAGEPRIAIVAFSPDKFLPHGCPSRTDARGTNLRWIPWNRTGWELFLSLNPRQRNLAVAQQAALPFYALADGVRSLWREKVEWERDRKRMRSASSERGRRIFESCRARAHSQDTAVVPTPGRFADLPLARDADLLVRGLRAEGVETRVVLLPWGNPELLARVSTPKAAAGRDSITALMREWLADRNLDVLDLTVPEALAHFPASMWDDAEHPKDPALFEYVSRRISDEWPLAAWPSGPFVSREAPGSPKEDE